MPGLHNSGARTAPGYTMVKNFEDTFIRFDMIHERDRQTDRQTPHDGIGRAYAWHRAAKMYICGVAPCSLPHKAKYVEFLNIF